jgi:hypothetical protein
MLERRAVKVACVVLRGLGEGDLAWLPGDRLSMALVEREIRFFLERLLYDWTY